MTRDDDEAQELARLRGEVARLTALTDRQTRELAALVALAEDRRFPGAAARRFRRSLRPRLGALRARLGRTASRALRHRLSRLRQRLAWSPAARFLGLRR